jgi:hypothetical protein
MPRNTGTKAAGQRELRKTSAARPTATPRSTTAEQAGTTETDVDHKTAKRGQFEPRSALDPTIDASAGHKATIDQRELATA